MSQPIAPGRAVVERHRDAALRAAREAYGLAHAHITNEAGAALSMAEAQVHATLALVAAVEHLTATQAHRGR